MLIGEGWTAYFNMLWRLGIAVDVVMQLCDVPVMLILFVLLSPVNKNIALLALLFTSFKQRLS